MREQEENHGNILLRVYRSAEQVQVYRLGSIKVEVLVDIGDLYGVQRTTCFFVLTREYIISFTETAERIAIRISTPSTGNMN